MLRAIERQIGTGQYKTVLIADEYMTVCDLCDRAYRQAQVPASERLLLAHGKRGAHDLVGAGAHSLARAAYKIAAAEEKERCADDGEREKHQQCRRDKIA